MIALDLDDAVTHGSSRTASLLQAGGQRVDIRRRQRQARHRGHALAGPSLDFPADPHRAGLRGTRRALGANTPANRPAAVGA